MIDQLRIVPDAVEGGPAQYKINPSVEGVALRVEPSTPGSAPQIAKEIRLLGFPGIIQRIDVDGPSILANFVYLDPENPSHADILGCSAEAKVETSTPGEYMVIGIRGFSLDGLAAQA